MLTSEMGIEAGYYRKKEGNQVECLLCPHHCTIRPGDAGKCRIRTNNNGTLMADMYGNLSAVHIDPVEKKPLYHFHPGKEILSLGGLGCNFSCNCCQNYSISQTGKNDFPRVIKMSLENILFEAEKALDNIGVAYTYNEPGVWYEYMFEIAKLIKEKGMKNAMVSNGYINKKPLLDLLPFMDAFNIDLKCFDSNLHEQFTGGKLKFVLNTLKAIVKEGRHLEVTHLLVPGLSDDIQKFNEMVNWIRDELGDSTPLHISRYFPKFHMDSNATPAEMLRDYAEIAAEKLHFVYLGNVSELHFQNTVCPACDTPVILREGYSIHLAGMANNGTCKSCGESIAIT